MKYYISNFWAAVVASIVFVTTALLLEGHDHVGKILVMEGAAFGISLGAEVIKQYTKEMTNLKYYQSKHRVDH
jgi:hypothetical protein